MSKRKGKKSLKTRINRLEKLQKEDRPALEFGDTPGVDEDIQVIPEIIKVICTNGNSRLTIKSVQMLGHIALVSDVIVNQFYRVVLFTDKANETEDPPTWADVYKNDDGLDAILSPRAISASRNEGQRFKVIMDKRFKLIRDPDAMVNDAVIFDFFRKLNIKSIETEPFWETGGLYLGFVGTSAVGIADFTFQIRCRYTEHSDT